MKLLLVFVLAAFLAVCSGCIGGNASATNRGAAANLNLGTF